MSGLIAITNAAASILWASGVGPVCVNYILDPSLIVHTNRVQVQFVDDEDTHENVIGNYARSGYDRGHLAPAADFAGRDEALLCTYRSSNISPMKPSFNREEWANVEKEVRDKAVSVGVPVCVTTIPVYGGTNSLCAYPVPSGYIKIVSTNGIAFSAWFKEQE